MLNPIKGWGILATTLPAIFCVLVNRFTNGRSKIFTPLARFIWIVISMFATGAWLILRKEGQSKHISTVDILAGGTFTALLGWTLTQNVVIHGIVLSSAALSISLAFNIALISFVAARSFMKPLLCLLPLLSWLLFNFSIHTIVQ